MPLEDLYPYLSLDELKRHLNFPTRNTSSPSQNKINK